MIERYSGMMQLVCECGVSQPRTYEADEFSVMVSDAKDDGWRITKEDDEWVHTCPDCLSRRRKGVRR